MLDSCQSCGAQLHGLFERRDQQCKECTSSEQEELEERLKPFMLDEQLAFKVGGLTIVFIIIGSVLAVALISAIKYLITGSV